MKVYRKFAQTDSDIIIDLSPKYYEQGLPYEEIVRKIAEKFLPIGFDLNYWKDKVQSVLENKGIIQKYYRE